MQKTAVIVNPAAGAGRSGSRWAGRRSSLREALGAFEELRTERPGHGAELARTALESGAKRIISVGGDGTWHEVVAGYFSAPEAARAGAALGCYPTGSGCDFARHLRYPREEDALLSVLSGDKTRLIDLVRATVTAEDGGTLSVPLTNMAAFGLGGDVARAVQRTGKRAGGTLSYLMTTVALLLRSRAREYTLKLDGKPLPERRLHTAILANTSSTGGGMLVAPDADATDGLFEVMTIGDVTRLRMLLAMRKLYSGRHLEEKGVSLYQGKRLEASLPTGSVEPSYLNLDGEALGRLPAVFEILPRIVPVLVP
ncbi:MAG: diacylglycerol kinase family protein [Elusimicrobiota bacterium]